MKSLIAASVLLALGSQALAAESMRAGPGPQAASAPLLAPGKPAGVQEAQRHHRFPLLLTVGVAALVAAGIVVAVENSNNGGCGSACGTTSTSP